MQSKGCAYLMDMGTGKTITTIAVAGTLFNTRNIKRLLVVSPKSIVQVWRRSSISLRHSHFPSQCWMVTVTRKSTLFDIWTASGWR